MDILGVEIWMLLQIVVKTIITNKFKQKNWSVADTDTKKQKVAKTKEKCKVVKFSGIDREKQMILPKSTCLDKFKLKLLQFVWK